jgi:hypothetical protein
MRPSSLLRQGLGGCHRGLSKAFRKFRMLTSYGSLRDSGLYSEGMNFEIAVCIFRFGLPPVEFLESLYESINALRIVLHFPPERARFPQGKNHTASRLIVTMERPAPIRSAWVTL